MPHADLWRPLHAAHKRPAGVWVMISPQGRCYGQVSALWDESRYRIEDEAGVLLGYAVTLRDAVEVVHRHFVYDHAPHGPINGK